MSAILDWLNSPAIHAFGAPTSWAELLGFLTGVLTVYLVAKQNIWTWPIGITNNILWIVLFITFGLYADGALQVIYIGLALWGWWMWLHGGLNRTELRVSRTTSRQWFALAAAGVLGTAAITVFLVSFTPSAVPFWDAATTTISLLAVWGQVKKKVESWYLWMLADIIYVPLYIYKGLTLTAILYVGFFALCLFGLARWRRSLREQSTDGAADTKSVQPRLGSTA